MNQSEVVRKNNLVLIIFGSLNLLKVYQPDQFRYIKIQPKNNRPQYEAHGNT